MSRVFYHRIPPITMGIGAIESLPRILHQHGQRVLVVTDPGVADQPFFEAIVGSLKHEQFQTEVFSEVLPDPPISVFQNGVKLAASFSPDAVLGIGGGSALDVAKIVSILHKHDCEISTLFGIDLVPGRGVPTILVSTTAGTGSEVTPIAVVSDETNQLKKGIVSDHIVPDHAIVDPKLCASLPPWPTAYTGMDALTHAIEAFTNQFAVPLIDAYALEAIRLIASNLPKACRDGNDMEARYAMSRGSMLGGMCLGPVNTAAVHAMAYPLGGRFKVPHGIANSLLLPHVARFNMPNVADRYQQIAQAMHAPHDDVVETIERLSAEVGTNKKMRDYGVTQSDLPSMAEDALKVTRLMNNNPRKMTVDDALAIYQAAW